MFFLFLPLLLTNSPSANPRGIKFHKGNLFLSTGAPKHVYFCCCVHNCFATMSTISATREDLWSHKACVMTCLSQNLQRKLHPATHLHFLCCYHLAGCLYPCIRAGWICVVWDLCWGFVGCLLFLCKKLRREIDTCRVLLTSTKNSTKNSPQGWRELWCVSHPCFCWV